MKDKDLNEELKQILNQGVPELKNSDDEHGTDFFDSYSFNKLNTREKLFVTYYVEDPSVVAKAVIKAGYSENGAPTRGYQLLKKQTIKDAINTWIRIKHLAKSDDAEDIKARIKEDIFTILDEIKFTEKPDRKIHLKALELLRKFITDGDINNQQVQQVINITYPDKEGNIKKFTLDDYVEDIK